ncbi:hypothetical protein FIBSPDRAFT_849583 [Athelia psychrophila]|uniref:Uncharacterized protein n=1 Tax=Athelia psychrophila TaxID=1759441 RepID=A0A167WEX2_9AGAM|nr:hypothetical protein FIBSPDRAFT_876889 [Fibularhizoctonia sp. CBS 109695]KZP31611.1 hypothetical protein FIBSPDRAFT_849583 [Fibularhizoctonia sp. CBS 109695]
MRAASCMTQLTLNSAPSIDQRLCRRSRLVPARHNCQRSDGHRSHKICGPCNCGLIQI